MTQRTIPMDTPHGREDVPATPGRLHGADRAGLGEKGWAEVPDDAAGHPDESNVAPDLFKPLRPRRTVAISPFGGCV